MSGLNLTEEQRAALEHAGWKEMASLGWRRSDNGHMEYVEPFTALIIAEWWINRAVERAS